MVRFGRGFPVPRQNFQVNPVSEVVIVTVILAPQSDPTAGIHYLSVSQGDLTILTSEEVVVDILGQGVGLSSGDLGAGAIDGGVSESADITGFGLGATSLGSITLTGDVYDQGEWVNPGGNVPRRKWKKKKPFKDFYYTQGVEFVSAIVNEQDYGPWFYIVDEGSTDFEPLTLRSEQSISSDYSIEGRP